MRHLLVPITCGLHVGAAQQMSGICSGADYLLVCVEQHADGAVWRLGAHALVVLPLFLQVGRSALPQVSQRFGPALPLQTALLYWGGLLWSLCTTATLTFSLEI